MINVDTENLENLLSDKPFEVTTICHGTRNYVNCRMIKRMANSMDDIDMALEKASFLKPMHLNQWNKKINNSRNL